MELREADQKTMREIYLDNQSVARPSDKVLEKIVSSLKRGRWNDHFATHIPDKNVFEEIEAAYKALYKLVDAHHEDQFVLTSSGAEAVNHAVFAAYLDITRKTGKNHFVAANIDERAALSSMSRLKEMGCVFHMAPANEKGIIDCAAIADTITPRTAMLSLSWANGLTGVIQPVSKIAQLCHDRGILFHVDATHMLGIGNDLFAQSGAAILTFDGCALHGPYGSGGLFIQRDLKLSPFIMGSDDQGGMRGGPIFLGTLLALAEAAKETLHFRDHLSTEIARLRSHFETAMTERIPSMSVLFEEVERVPHISTLAFPGVMNASLLFWLAREKVFATIGGQGFQNLATLLQACHVKASLAHSSLSFGFSRGTSQEEIAIVCEKLTSGVHHLQKYSKQLNKWD